MYCGVGKNAWLHFGLEAFQILTSRMGYTLEGIISEESYWKMEWISQECNITQQAIQ